MNEPRKKKDRKQDTTGILQRPAVEAFSDYNDFLRTIFAYLKKVNGLSYRSLAEKSGLSLGYVHMVCSGRRSLDSKHIPALSTALGLSDSETYFLGLLVQLADSKDARQKAAVYKKMSRRGTFRSTFNLERSHLAYLSSWLPGTLLALVDHPHFSDDPSWIAEALRPQVTHHAIREAWTTLQQLSLVTQDASGHWCRTQNFVAAPDESLGMDIVKTYHSQRLELQQWAINQLPAQERNFGAITAQLDQQGYQSLLQFMHEMRHQIIEKLQTLETENGEIVAHINWQTFLVSGALEQASSPAGEPTDV